MRIHVEKNLTTVAAWPLVLVGGDGGDLPPVLATTLHQRLERSKVTAIPTLGLHPAPLLVAIGAPSSWDDLAAVRKRGGAAGRLLMAEQATAAVLRVPEGISPAAAAALVLGLAQACYAFDRYLPKKAVKLADLAVVGGGITTAVAAQLSIVANEITRARDLTNTPAEDCGPDQLEEEIRRVAKDFGLGCTVHDEKACAKKGMGALLAVGRASPRRPRMAVLTWPGLVSKKAKKTATVGGGHLAICGKGVCFDTGGLDIKPSSGMELMRKDMGGAAVTLSVMAALAQVGGTQPVRAYLPLVENSIAGDAFRPGDVLRAMDGTTIEIGNTDAEGRLILADALCLARAEGAARLITVATLTGAALVALGRIHVPLMGTDEVLLRRIESAAAATGEKVWRLPLEAEHRELIASTYAQINNAGPGEAGCITAGSFLAHFAGKVPFAHLDISPASWIPKAHDLGPAGATGVMISTLLQVAQGG